MNSLRGQVKDINNLKEIEMYCKNNNIELKYEDVINIKRNTVSRCYNLAPQIVIEFFKKLAIELKSENILNPCDKYGELLISILKEKDDCSCTGVFEIEDKDILKEVIDEKLNILDSIEEIENNRLYDLIVSVPPFGLRKMGSSFREYSLELINDMKDILSHNGYIVFLLTSSTIESKSNKNGFDLLIQNGIYINGVIDLPQGTFAPYTNIETKILIMSKSKTEKRFIANLDDIRDVTSVVNSFVNKKSARNYTNGMFVDEKKYPYMSEFLKEKLFEKIYKGFIGHKYILRDIAEKINLPDKNNEFNHEKNSIYIPKIGKGDVVLTKDDFNIKSQNYIQIVLDQEKVSASYACFYFNTPGGKIIREKSATGHILQLNKVSVGNLPIIIPSLDDQIGIIETYRKMHDLENQLEAVKNKFLSKPAIYYEINRNIDNINNEETLEDWIETLPFPLASILRRYVVTVDAKDRQEILFYFFEAYALFNSTILLSILGQYKKELPIGEILKDCNLDYYVRGSFGNWVVLLNSISNYLYKSFINKPDKKEEIKYFFKTNDMDVIEMLCDKDIINTLNKAKLYRNDWKGHGGICSDKIYKLHDNTLAELLNELRKKVRDIFKNLKLVRSINIKSCIKNNYTNNIEILMGSNSQFKKDTFETAGYGMDNLSIYIVIEDTQKLLKLIPLIIFKSSPESVKNACYFYSKTEKENTKYVSYHYEDMPQDIEQGIELYESLKELFE